MTAINAKTPGGKVAARQSGKSEIREVVAKAGNSREKAQKTQEKAPFPYLLRHLRLFAASSAIGSRSPKSETNGKKPQTRCDGAAARRVDTARLSRNQVLNHGWTQIDTDEHGTAKPQPKELNELHGLDRLHGVEALARAAQFLGGYLYG